VTYQETLARIGAVLSVPAPFLKRDKVSLDIFWLKDESLEDSANLPAPDLIAAEIAEDLQATLDQFTQIAVDLRK
jgi:type I restriction enzyme M protein